MIELSTENSEICDDKEKTQKLTKFPLSRIKHLMKLDADVNLANQESVIVICRATELFLDNLVREASTFTLQAKRKILQKKDIDTAVDKIDNFVFLEGTLDDVIKKPPAVNK